MIPSTTLPGTVTGACTPPKPLCSSSIHTSPHSHPSFIETLPPQSAPPPPPAVTTKTSARLKTSRCQRVGGGGGRVWQGETIGSQTEGCGEGVGWEVSAIGSALPSLPPFLRPRLPPPLPHPPAPPPGSPGWYDLPDYKTALPCVCLFSVPDN